MPETGNDDVQPAAANDEMRPAAGNDKVLPEQLVVDTNYLGQVAGLLHGRGITIIAQRQNFDLDLVLLEEIIGLADYAARVSADVKGAALAKLRLDGQDTNVELSPLDLLMYELRQEIKPPVDFGPFLGKNRESVIGYPIHKGVGTPDPAQGPPPAPPFIDGGTGAGIRIGVVDTGIYRHPTFHDKSIEGDPFLDPPAEDAAGVRPVTPWFGHGTFVAGLIWRYAPQATIVARTGLSPDTGAATTWDTATKIARLSHDNVSIVNLALGVAAETEPPFLIRRAVEKLGSDVLVIAAAGNRGNLLPPPEFVWPAAMIGVKAVGAIDDSGEQTVFTMKADWVKCTAKALGIVSTYLDKQAPVAGVGEFNGYAEWSGTSFAAAKVTGAVAARASKGGSALSAFDALVAENRLVVFKYPTQPGFSPGPD